MPYMPCQTKGCNSYRKTPNEVCAKCAAKAEAKKAKRKAKKEAKPVEEVKEVY